jgi:hypothetical protein
MAHSSIGMGEIRKMNDMLLEHSRFGDGSLFRVLPLHSMVSTENQGAVFDIPARGIRKIVIATNIAETGEHLSVFIMLARSPLTRHHHPRHHLRDRYWQAPRDEVTSHDFWLNSAC